MSYIIVDQRNRSFECVCLKSFYNHCNRLWKQIRSSLLIIGIYGDIINDMPTANRHRRHHPHSTSLITIIWSWTALDYLLPSPVLPEVTGSSVPYVTRAPVMRTHSSYKYPLLPRPIIITACPWQLPPSQVAKVLPISRKKRKFRKIFILNYNVYIYTYNVYRLILKLAKLLIPTKIQQWACRKVEFAVNVRCTT